MKYKVKVLEIEKLVNVTVSNLFLSKEYLLSLRDCMGFNAKYLTVDNIDSGLTESVMVIYIKKILGIPYVISPQIVYYQPIEYFLPVSKHHNERELKKLKINQIISEYISSKFLKFNGSFSPQIKDVRGFLWKRIKAIPRYTFTINLDNHSQDLLFRKQRSLYRNSLKRNYTYNFVSNIKDFLYLQKQTIIRQDWNFKFDDKKLISLCNSFEKKGLLKQLNILDNSGNIVAVMLYLTFEKDETAYAWLCATSSKEMTFGATLYMYMTLIEVLKGKFKVLDLCGANTDTIARFKASIGAELEVFYYLSL